MTRYNPSLTDDAAQAARQMAAARADLLPGGLHPLVLLACYALPWSDLREPWLAGGFVCSTNGRLFVAQPVDTIDPGYLARVPIPRPPDARLAIDPARMLSGEGQYRTEPIVLARSAEARYRPPACPECGGNGHDCYVCNGTGRDLTGSATFEVWPGLAIESWHAWLLAVSGARLFVPARPVARSPVAFSTPDGRIQGVCRATLVVPGPRAPMSFA